MINNPTFELTPVFPHGLVITGAGQAPFILFKDESKALSFPLWLPYNPAKMQHNITEAKLYRAPALLSQDILKFFDREVEACIFTQVKSGVQWAKIILKGVKKDLDDQAETSMNILAYEAFSLGALDRSVKYFATEEFIKATREDEIKDKNNVDFGKEKALRKHGQKYLM